MKIHLFFRFVLTLHIIGVVVMAGTTMIDYLTYKTFLKLSDAGDARSLGLIPLMAGYGAFVRAGAVTIIFTGIALSMQEKGLFWRQPWFRIKMALVILLVLNGIFIGNKLGHKLRDGATADIRGSMNWFYPIQLTLFFLIILISVIGGGHFSPAAAASSTNQ